MKTCLALYGDIAIKGMPFYAENGNKALLRLILTSYVDDAPGTEDLLELNCGSRRPASCYLCAAKRESFPFSIFLELQTLFSTKNILKKRENASTKFKKESLQN